MYRADGEVPGAPGAKVEGNHEPLPASPVLLLVEVRRMADQSWFRHWAKESLLSDDLDALTDHEERVWWRLLSAASLDATRWSVDVTPRLAVKCKSTPQKLRAALQRFAELCMVEWDGEDRIAITNASRWNEDKNGKPPSAEPGAVKERVRRHRAAKRNDPVTTDGNEGSNDPVTTHVTRYSNDHKEEEKEKEEEQEEERAPKRRLLTLQSLSSLETEYPDFDLPAARLDYLNYGPNRKHVDQIRGFRNMLDDPNRNWRFRKGGNGNGPTLRTGYPSGNGTRRSGDLPTDAERRAEFARLGISIED